MPKFIADENVPIRVVTLLRDEGNDVLRHIGNCLTLLESENVVILDEGGCRAA
jgi:hypothetical protein